MSIFTSLLTAGSNSHQETSENVNALATDFVTPGVVGTITNTAGVAPMTGAFAINAQGSPNMTVAVSAGVAWAAATPSSQNSQTLRIRNTASVNVTISANVSGSTKFDWIYLSVAAANAANPAVDASDVTTVVVSRSSSNTSDNGTPPTYGINLGYVTVANGASSITNGNITDNRSRAFPTPPLGTVVQMVTATSSAVATGTTVVPEDDTIPQITEGTEFLTQAITPKSSTNRLLIRVKAFLSQSASTNDIIGALFQDTTANALAAQDIYAGTSGAPICMVIEHDMVAGTAASTTFRFRAGPVNAATATFNGLGGARKFGGITLSSLSIIEYKA